MEVDKLLIVAHPDDEILWGGSNLLSQSGWFVICSTHLNDPVRSREFFSTMSYCNVTRYIMFDVKDEYTEDPLVADKLYDGSIFDNFLKKLATKSWKLVLSHSEKGEYGHEHHRKVHRMVKKYFHSAKFFDLGPKLSPHEIEHKRNALLFYRKTQSICKTIFNKKSNTLKLSERQFFFNEKLFISERKEIPKIINQIWFGKPLAENSVRYHLMKNVETLALKNGYQYKLWTNNDLFYENFPLVWEFIQLAIEKGEELEQSRFAQVADLARLEILHRFGGIYLDSLFEISIKFLDFITKNNKRELIVANEDPCELNCKGIDGKKYMSNGFFAAQPGSSIIKRLLNYDVLENVDWDSVYINRTTGPYFFRSAMKSSDDILVIPTEKIYPFMVNDSAYRKAKPNECITSDDKVLHNCLKEKYPNSLVIYHSGFGGSWSW
jgi:LmbE family N-acetylglucosaminyl deacetylase